MKTLYFMNPFATWADVLLKSGKAALESLQESAKSRPARVAVIPTPDAPPHRAPAPRKPPKARAKAKAAPKRKPRARSARSSSARRR